MLTRIITASDVAELVSMEAAVEAVEEAFAAHARGEARMPPKVYLDLPEHGGDFRAMPATMGRSAGVKWVNSHPENPARHGLPTVMGVYVLSDPATALPLAIMDGTLLTAIRTGAAAAVASKHLARPEPETLGLVGCGVQAEWLIAAHRVLWPDVEVVGYDLRPEAAVALVERLGGRVGSLLDAAACDIVCTSTPGREPVVMASMVRAGTHVNAMGADAEGKQELEPAILKAATVVVDDPAQAFHSGEVNVPLHRGELSEADVHGTLGEVVVGSLPGRSGAEAITVFDSTGLAIQDVAVARALYEAAALRGVGVAVDLVGAGA